MRTYSKKTRNHADFGATAEQKERSMMSNLKKLILFVAFAGFINVSAVQAQDSEIRKGYIGLNVGVATVTGEYKDYLKTGAEFSFNFGYLFMKNVGIHATLYGTSFPAKNNNDATLGLAGLMVGPLFSTSSGKFEFDARPMAGISNGVLQEGSGSSSESSLSELTFTFGVGGTVRWNCWKKFSLAANVNYYYGKPEKVDLSSLGVTIGVNYRLK